MGSSGDDGYVVGLGGTLIHTTDRGMTWTPVEIGTSSDLFGIWGSGSNDVYIVGASGLASRRGTKSLSGSARRRGGWITSPPPSGSVADGR